MNEEATRSLWSIVKIQNPNYDNTCDAILRLPARARCVRRLSIVVPGISEYSAPSNLRLGEIFNALTALRELSICRSPDSASPILPPNPPIQLRSFSTEFPLEPSFVAFLESQQTTIDAFHSNVNNPVAKCHIPKGLLPNLREITASCYDLMGALVLGRPVSTFTIDAQPFGLEFWIRFMATSSVDVTRITADLSNDGAHFMPTFLRLLIAFPRLEYLRYHHDGGVFSAKELAGVLKDFPCLKALELRASDWDVLGLMDDNLNVVEHIDLSGCSPAFNLLFFYSSQRVMKYERKEGEAWMFSMTMVSHSRDCLLMWLTVNLSQAVQEALS